MAHTRMQQNLNQAPRPMSTKPVKGLRPSELACDSSMSTLRAWKEQFRAYHSASNMRTLSHQDQQAFLLHNLNSDVARCICMQATETTTIFKVDGGPESCYCLLDTSFKESNPLLFGHMEFFSYRQTPGQSNFQFRDALRCISEDGDLESMTFQDALVFNMFKELLTMN